MTNASARKYPNDIIVEVVDNLHSHGFQIGELVKIKTYFESDGSYLCRNILGHIFFVTEPEIKLSHKTRLRNA